MHGSSSGNTPARHKSSKNCSVFVAVEDAIWVECIVDALSDELPYGRMGLLEVPLYF